MLDDVIGLADLYEWGYPLVQLHRTRARHGSTPGLIARARLSGANDREVVAPNNDTLYSSGWYDLSAGSLTVDAGAMDRPDRYWSVMLLDAYTHVRYVSRRGYGIDGARVEVVYDPDAAPGAQAANPRVVRIGTPTVWILVRVLVDGPDDLAAAQRCQASIAIRAPARVAAGPPIFAHAESLVAADFFDDLRDAFEIDPPAAWHPSPPSDPHHLLDRRPEEEAAAAAVALATHRIERHRFADSRRNGWATRTRGAAFGDDVRYRAAVARYSLAAHLPAENRSYHRSHDGRAAWRLRLPPGEPPVSGFWSVTVYGLDGFFVPNQLDRFSISDRTPGLCRDDDGALTLVLDSERPADSANWLPTPAGPCVLALRAYEGLPAVEHADWFPPPLQPAS